MSNFAAVVRNEISRLSSREVRKGTPALKRASARYRREIAQMKREIRSMQRSIEYLLKRNAALDTPGSKQVKITEKVRFSAQWLRRNREKLGLSAKEYAKLAGVSALTIYGWEKERAKPRAKHLPMLAELRKLGKKEARFRLEVRKS